MAQIPNLILFDGPARENLLPLTYTRPVAEQRIGISTIREKWELLTSASASWHTQDYLAVKYSMQPAIDNLFIDGAIIPSDELVAEILKLKKGDSLLAGDKLIAYRAEKPVDNFESLRTSFKKIEYSGELIFIEYPWDIFSLNGKVLTDDFKRITSGRKSQPLSDTNTIMGAENVFLEEGASVECAIINATTGPVYIGKDAEIMEGSVVRGPFAMCEHAVLKMSAKIYGPTTLGPYCKVGGEVNNSVFTACSNKAHDGFLGNSVIGEWCNLGADTNNSNLKNNYAKVKMWNYPAGRFIQTGLQFCGLIMGDHSKCGINTMFNTGTVVGVSANIYGAGFPRNFVPSFAWGGPGGIIEYKTNKAFETAEIVMGRRNMELTEVDRNILLKVHELSARYRK